MRTNFCLQAAIVLEQDAWTPANFGSQRLSFGSRPTSLLDGHWQLAAPLRGAARRLARSASPLRGSAHHYSHYFDLSQSA